jgi:hypothetical protein
MRKGIDSLDDTGKLGAHASAVVHNKADTHGSVSVIEHCEISRLPLFKYMKVFLLQTRDERSARIGNINGKKDEAATHRDFRLVLCSSGIRFRESLG